MLHFMSKNKRILNMHEKIFSELEIFQENTTLFQTNTNASLKNLETRIKQLALNMQNQSKGLVPSDTRKDPRECMAILLRIGRELDERRVEKKDTEEENYAKIREEFKQHSLETIEEEKTTKMYPEQQVEKGNPGKKKEVKVYEPQVPFPQRLQKAKLEEKIYRFLYMFKKIKINIPFSEALTQMPLYAKFMKKILSRKRKIVEEGIVNLTATYRAVIHNSLPEKM